VIYGGYGADSITGGAGKDTFAYSFRAESEGETRDTIAGFDAHADIFHLGEMFGDVSGVDTAVTRGTLNDATFDADMEKAVAESKLAVNPAVLFTPNHGGLAGNTFLLVDVGGAAGYQAGDYVFELTNGLHLADLSADNFTS